MSYHNFSVAISVYKNDRAEHFERSLESITDLQTIRPSEIVLVVDGPVGDDLNDVIAKYEIKYDIFKVIRLPQNGGLGNALRIAIDECSYELIARMDSDDVAIPTRFEEQMSFFNKNSPIDIVGGDITEFIDYEDNIVGKRVVPRAHDDIVEYMKHRCAFNHVTVMYRKSAVQKAGGYLDWFWNEDYYLWIRMMECGCTFANTGTVLVNVRTGADMYKRRGGKKYYRSEIALQKYMREKRIITSSTYFMNCFKRFVVQRLLPNGMRGWVFRTFARKNKNSLARGHGCDVSCDNQ